MVVDRDISERDQAGLYLRSMSNNEGKTDPVNGVENKNSSDNIAVDIKRIETWPQIKPSPLPNSPAHSSQTDALGPNVSEFNPYENTSNSMDQESRDKVMQSPGRESPLKNTTLQRDFVFGNESRKAKKDHESLDMSGTKLYIEDELIQIERDLNSDGDNQNPNSRMQLVENLFPRANDVSPSGDKAFFDDANFDEESEESELNDDEWSESHSVFRFRARIENFNAMREIFRLKFERGEDDCVQPIKTDTNTSKDGFKWGLLVFPNGLPLKPPENPEWGRFLSVFLEIRDTSDLVAKYDSSWKLKRRYRLRVVNQSSSSKLRSSLSDTSTDKDISSRSLKFSDKVQESIASFRSDSTDWGFTQLISLDLLKPSTGFLGDDGSLELMAEVMDIPDSCTYDSKLATGYVGLENHGATCYLNSLLQTLYMMKSLRLAVYDLDTTTDKRNGGIGLELQRLFWRLQTANEAVPTRQLTSAFGWDSDFLFRQHDVQEMNRELMDKLESRMKNTPQEGYIKRLYTGRMRSYVKCIDVDFTSVRDETFYDLQLIVKKVDSVYQAFSKYIEEEKLQGENQYEADGYGKQDANKGVVFLSFPPVLNLHLKRFEYDMNRDATVKINDKFKFPLRLVLDRFLYKENENDPESASPSGNIQSDPPQPQYEYVLHSVLVHVGSIDLGHYYAFINDMRKIDANSSEQQNANLKLNPDSGSYEMDLDSPEFRDLLYSGSVDGNKPSASLGAGSGQPVKPRSSEAAFPPGYSSRWLRFDDEKVSVASKTQAVDQNFGGKLGVQHRLASGVGSAYMLVYIQVSRLSEILPDVPNSRVPRSLLERFERDLVAAKAEREADELRRNSACITIVTEKDLRERPAPYVRFLPRWKRSVDFVDFSACESISIRNDATVGQLYEKVAAELSLTHFVIWTFVDRKCDTSRPEVALLEMNRLCLNVLSSVLDEWTPIFVDSRSSFFSPPPFCICDENERTSGQEPTIQTWDVSERFERRKIGMVPDMRTLEHDGMLVEEASPSILKNEMQLSLDSTPAWKRVKPNPLELRDYLSHSLLFFREFNPNGLTESEKLVHIGHAMVCRAITVSDFVSKCLIKLLQEANDPSVNVSESNFLLWELYSPSDMRELLTHGDEVSTEASFIDKYELQNGDIIVFQRILFDEKDENKTIQDDLTCFAGSDRIRMGADGVRRFNWVPISHFRHPPTYLKFLNNRFYVSIVSRGAHDMSERIRIELPFNSGYMDLVRLIAKSLYAEGKLVNPEVEQSHIQLYRAGSAFRYVEQADPLEAIDPSCDAFVYFICRGDKVSGMPSIWNPPGEEKIQHAPSTLESSGGMVPNAHARFFKSMEHVLFYEVLPCPVEHLDRCFEFHVAKGPSYAASSTVIAALPLNKVNPNFSVLQDAAIAKLDSEGVYSGDSDGLLRWLVVDKDSNVLQIFAPFEELLPERVLPSLVDVRKGTYGSGFGVGGKFLVVDIVEPKESSIEYDPKITSHVAGPHVRRIQQSSVSTVDERKHLVTLFHFHSPVPEKGKRARRFGIPFSLVLSPEDTPETVLSKCRERLCVTASDSATWKLAIFKLPLKTGDFQFCEDGMKLRFDDRLFPPDAMTRAEQDVAGGDLYVSFKYYPTLGIFHSEIPVDEKDRTNDLRRSTGRGNDFHRSSGGHSPIICKSAIETPDSGASKGSCVE